MYIPQASLMTYYDSDLKIDISDYFMPSTKVKLDKTDLKCKLQEYHFPTVCFGAV